MEQGVISERERNNKVAMTAHVVEVAIMNIFCLLQMISGRRAGVLFALDVILGFVPVLAEVFFWKKDRETTMIKHLVGYGFALFYTYTLFTCDNNMVFAFVIPMILMISIFHDMAYSIKINVGTIILSILMNVIGSQNGKLGYEGMDDAIVMVVVMILTAIFSIYSSKTSFSNSQQKLDEAEKAHNESEKLLQEVKIISQRLHDGIRDIYRELEKLSNVSQTTKESMAQLSTGAAETADAVQKQTYQTEAIQSKVGLVTDVTESITESMQQTLQVLEEGNKDVEILVEQRLH